MDARASGDADLTKVAHRSSLDELTAWTEYADKVLVFGCVHWQRDLLPHYVWLPRLGLVRTILARLSDHLQLASEVRLGASPTAAKTSKK
jgi:hypothetical protein